MARKLLAINFGGIGDEILFLPVLASIKESLPDMHITLLVEPRSKAIKDISNLIDEIKLFDIKKPVLLPHDYLNLLRILRSGEYETVISSGASPLVSCLLFASGIKERIGYYSGLLSKKLLTQAIPLNKHQYASTMYHDLVQGLGLKHKSVVPHIQISEENLNNMSQWLIEQSDGQAKLRTVIIHPGTSKLSLKKGIIKTWPPANWASLINQLTKNPDIRVVLAGGPEDEQTIEQILSELNQDKSFAKNTGKFISAYGITKSLADLAALISLGDLLICVDSAPMHVGVALKKQLLAIFGPTDPLRLLPMAPQYRYIKDNRQHNNGHKGLNVQPNIVFQSASDLLQIVKAQ